MAKLLKLNKATAVKEPVRVYLDEDQEDWLDLRPEMTRKEFYRLAGKTQNANDEEKLLVSANMLFKLLVLDWSVVEEDENGNLIPVPVSEEAFEQLPFQAQAAIDRKIQEHLTTLMQRDVAEIEEKSETPHETSDSDES